MNKYGKPDNEQMFISFNRSLIAFRLDNHRAGKADYRYMHPATMRNPAPFELKYIL